MSEKMIRVLKVEPGKEPEVTTLKNELYALQDAVSIGAKERGCIEIVALEVGVCLLLNEEGKLLMLTPNRRLGNDFLAGVFYVVGTSGENLCSLNDEQIQKYMDMFKEPDTFDPFTYIDYILDNMEMC